MGELKTRLHAKAVRMLVAATVLWGISFPITKGIAALQERLVPHVSTWFYSSLSATTRFSVAGLIVLVLCARTLRRITCLEIWQGLGLGFFGGIGILLQMDGLAHTSASISAFLTQTFCIYVPIIVALRDKKLPGLRMVISTLLLLIGVAVLNHLSLYQFHLARGEWETIGAAFIFSGQIVWLERPLFKGNNVLHMSLVMFGMMTALAVPVVLMTMTSGHDLVACYSNLPLLILLGVLTLLCTAVAYVAMNKWQPYVPAAEASIIYGVEPVLASAFALFLPRIISRFSGIDYPNETLTSNLLIGGILIVIANLILQLKAEH